MKLVLWHLPFLFVSCEQANALGDHLGLSGNRSGLLLLYPAGTPPPDGGPVASITAPLLTNLVSCGILQSSAVTG